MKNSRKSIRMLAVFLTAALLFSACPLFAAAEALPERISYDPTPEAHLRELPGGACFADNELLVFAVPGTDPAAVARVLAPFGGKIVGRIALADEYQVRFSDVRTESELETLAAVLEEAPRLERVSLHLFAGCTPQYYDVGDKWRRDLEDSTDCLGSSWHAEVVNAPAAWAWMDAYAEYLYPVKVGMVDSGFWPHEDLVFDDIYNYRSDGYDEHYEHGTAVAGVIGADSQNTAGIMGIYPYGHGNLLGFSFYQKENETDLSSEYVDAAGVAWLLEHGARVINVSMGDKNVVSLYYYEYILHDTDAATALYERKARMAANLGVFLQRYLDSGYDFLIVCSAGNYSNDTTTIKINGSPVDVYVDSYINALHNSYFTRIFREDFPDVYDRILVVGALKDRDTVSEFSGVGDRVDVYAPGEHILTTTPETSSETPTQQGYSYHNGTSFSAPIISGIAANILTVTPWLTCAEVRDVIKYIAGPYQNQEGFPRNPDVLTAVRLAAELRNELAVGEPNSYGLTLPPRHADVDRDGAVTAADARYALRLAVKLEDDPSTSIPFRHADMDKDGAVSAADARAILRIAVKLDPLPITY